MGEEKKGLSIASMVLGIVSLAFWYLAIPCAILAIIFGIIGRKKGGKGMATAGLVLGIISLVILIIIMAVGVTAISGLNSVDWNTYTTTAY